MLSPSGPLSSPRYARKEHEICRYSGTNSCAQALEGKDVKDLLLNVGSGGGAAAPAAGGAAGGEAAAAEEKPAEEEEGMEHPYYPRCFLYRNTDILYSQGGVRRGYGLRSLRLECLRIQSPFNLNCITTVRSPSKEYLGGRGIVLDKKIL